MKKIRKLFAICAIFVVLLTSVVIPAQAYNPNIEIEYSYPSTVEEYDRWLNACRDGDNFFEDFVDYHEKLFIFGEFSFMNPLYIYREYLNTNADYMYGFSDGNNPKATGSITVYHTFGDSVRNLINNDPLGQTMLYQRTQVTGIVARERLNYYYKDGYLRRITFRIEGAELHINLTEQTFHGGDIPQVSVVNQLLSVDEEEFQEGYAILWDAMGGLVEYPSNFVVFLQMAWNFTLRFILPILVIGAIAFSIYKGIDRIKKHRWKKHYCS